MGKISEISPAASSRVVASPAPAAPSAVPLTAYAAAEQRLAVPPVSERGRKNENPKELGFWELLHEDYVTHDSDLFEQGLWAVANNRFGNWRMGIKSRALRVPCTAVYRALEKGIEIFGGITLPYTTKLGRRVRLWRHGGMIIGARAIGNDVHIRQNTTIGVAQTWRDDDLPIIEDGADIGCGASILGPVGVGRGDKLGAHA